jgi:hypothetical protein
MRSIVLEAGVKPSSEFSTVIQAAITWESKGAYSSVVLVKTMLPLPRNGELKLSSRHVDSFETFGGRMLDLETRVQPGL